MKVFPVMAAVLLLLFSCGRGEKAGNAPATTETEDASQDAWRWADSVLRKLTLEEKAAQLLMPALYSRTDCWTLDQLREYAGSCVGGILLLQGISPDASRVSDSISRWSMIPPFVALDAEWGLAMRFKDAPSFPLNSRISAEADEAAMYDYGAEVARECRLVGVNMVLGPVLDVDAPGGKMGRRSFGRDPRRVATLGVAYGRGVTDGGVIAVAKHFPGHGSAPQDSHVRTGTIGSDLARLDSVDLLPFREWIRQGLPAIMAGHLALPAVDSLSRPAAVSPAVLTGLLKKRMRFEGLVLTDALNMKGAEGYGPVDAILAGADIVVAPVSTPEAIESIVSAVKSGRLPQRVLNEHVRRVLFHKYLLTQGVTVAPHAADSLPSSLYHPDDRRTPTPDSISRLLN